MPFEEVEGNKVWIPTPRQEDFIQIPFDVFEALYGGAVGGGKSEMLMLLPVVYGFYKEPRYHGILFRRSFPQLDESLIMRSHEYYKPLGGVYNDTKHFWKFPSGAIQRFSHLETEDTARKHDTSEYNFIGFDELTEFTKFQYTYMTSRCRSSSNLPHIVRSGTNPGNIGHEFVRKRFVDPCATGNKIIYDILTKERRIFIPSKMTDNPHLMKNNPNYVNQLNILPEAERKAKISGDWYSFEGQVFTEFSKALHVIKPFKIPDWWPKIVGIDWGYTAFCAVYWAAISPDNRIFIYREYVHKKEKVSTWASNIARLSQFDGNIKAIELDPSAWHERGEEQTIAQLFAKYSGWNPAKANNDRLGGKMQIHELLRHEQHPNRYVPPEGYNEETSQRILRMYGVEKQKEYYMMFQPQKLETNLPRLQIFDFCSHIIDLFPTLIYDDKRKEDVKEFDGDDPYDAFRYLSGAVERYEDSSLEENQRRTLLGDIEKQLETSGDQTKFYRQMEKFEADNSEVWAVARHHRGTVH